MWFLDYFEDTIMLIEAKLKRKSDILQLAMEWKHFLKEKTFLKE